MKRREFFRLLYIKLFKINDSPQRIALGFGLGVFLGIIPGTGPLAALFLALLFRVNRASALLGSLLTNTWLSIVTFLLAIKVGSAIMHLDWQVVRQGWMLLPVILGYFIVSFSLGILVYLVTLIILKICR
jgi:uncharacterized protein (DUF2062 family)